jgi:hypothetical protein
MTVLRYSTRRMFIGRFNHEGLLMVTTGFPWFFQYLIPPVGTWTVYKILCNRYLLLLSWSVFSTIYVGFLWVVFPSESHHILPIAHMKQESLTNDWTNRITEDNLNHSYSRGVNCQQTNETKGTPQTQHGHMKQESLTNNWTNRITEDNLNHSYSRGVNCQQTNEAKGTPQTQHGQRGVSQIHPLWLGKISG